MRMMRNKKITCGPPLFGWCFFQTKPPKGTFFSCRTAGGPGVAPESRPHLEQGASPARRRAVNLRWSVDWVTRHWRGMAGEKRSHLPSCKKGIFWVLVLELGISFLHVMIESKTFPWWWFTIIERIMIKPSYIVSVATCKGGDFNGWSKIRFPPNHIPWKGEHLLCWKSPCQQEQWPLLGWHHIWVMVSIKLTPLKRY